MLRAIVFALALIGSATAAGPSPVLDPATGRPIEDFPVAPAPLTTTQPVYPPAAERAGTEGAVRAILTLDAAGAVTKVDIAAETPPGQGFATAAATALAAWRFPADIAGRYRIKITFDLPDPPAALPEAPRPVKRILPNYPHDAWKARLPGEAVVAAEIGDDGEVDDVALLSETPTGHGFGPAAVEAVKLWIFPEDHPGRYQVRVKFQFDTPTASDGSPVGMAPEAVEPVRVRYPLAALNAGGIEGQVETIITLDAAGAVTHVEIAYEHPPGYGFGEALAEGLKKATFPAGVAGRYLFSGRFRIEGSPDDVAVDVGQLKPAPEPWHRRTPIYPPDAKAKGIEGAAEVAVFLENGDVTNALLLGANPEGHGFGESAYNAVIRWRWADTPDGAYRVRVEFHKGR
ncbi:hypothetical protein sos41_23360 [Alphaproteobacteria bacterium SO-S41]|nr:hypothetical protein sos41_23360 [Alphaproteobacteria bacterium SO-S41]